MAVGECDAQGLPSDIALEVNEYALAHGTTKSNEDLFNHLRKRVRSPSNGQLQGATVWHSSLTSPIMVESDMPSLQPSSQDRLAAKRDVAVSQVPPSHFDARNIKDISVGEGLLKRFAEPAAWPSMSAERFLLRPFGQHALLHCDGHFNRLKLLWQARLATPGSLLLHKAAGLQAVGHWVVRATDWGVLTWRVSLKSRNGRKVLELAQSRGDQPPWEQIVILSFEEYFVMEVTAPPPTIAKRMAVLGDRAQSSAIVLLLDEEKGKEPLVRHVARSGFRGLTVTLMDKLLKLAEVDYQPPKPTTEKALAELLVDWQFPKNTPAETEAMVAQRGAKEKVRHDTILSEQNVHVVEGVVDEDDMPVVKAAVKANGVGKAREAHKDAKARGSGAQASGSGDASKPDAPQSPDPTDAPKARPPIPSGSYTVVEARAFLPVGVRAWIGVHSNHAWQAKYPDKNEFPRSHTSSWDESVPCRTNFHCLLSCLRSVWDVHERQTGERCPWQLPEPSGLS